MTTAARGDWDRRFQAAVPLLDDAANSEEWREAIAVIDAAAEAGHAQAAEKRALFEYIGLGRAPDWNRALEWLDLAAKRGHEPARRQLAILRDGLAAPVATPRSRIMSQRPLVRAIDGFATPAECGWLIDLAAPRLERAIVYNNTRKSVGVAPGRTNQFAPFALSQLDLVLQRIRNRIASAIGAPIFYLEVPQLLRYCVGEEFTDHCDFLDPDTVPAEIEARGQRAATVLVYLNDDYEGGETSFPLIGLNHRGRTGDGLVFSNLNPAGQPEPLSRHAGRPPTNGQKWVLSQWVRDRAPA